MRKFKVVNRVKNHPTLAMDVKMPKRSTEYSAGYDFYAVEDVDINPIGHCAYSDPILEPTVFHQRYEPTLVRTGIKASMMNNEFLMLCNRSSNPKKGLILANGVGIVDSDYYGNENNDGEIMFSYLNIGNEPISINAGDKIGQGIFMKYYVTDDDDATGGRAGGFGSTGD